MNVSKLRTELEHRLSLDVNDDYGIEESWKNLTSILSDNIVDTINFFSKECTDEELFWLSEVFSDISEIVQNKEFVQVLRSRLSQVTRESYDQNSFKSEHMKKWIDYNEYVRSVNLDIDYAEGVLKEA